MNKGFLALALVVVAASFSSKAQALDEVLATSRLDIFAMDFDDRNLGRNENSETQEWFVKQNDEKGYFFLKKAAWNRRLSDRVRQAALFLMFKGFPARSETLLKQLDTDYFDENKPLMKNYCYRLHTYLKGVPPPKH